MRKLSATLNLFGLVTSLVGGILLAYALTLRPTNFRLVQTSDSNGMALCLGDKTVQAGFGGPLVVTSDPCPDTLHTGPTPEVLTNHPSMTTWGIRLIIAGFAFQLPAAIKTIRET
jgi:hypothetical protein